MTFEHWVGIIGGCLPIVSALYYILRKVFRTEFKVELMWDFMFRRGIAEAVSNGWAKMNSPLVLQPGVAEWFGPLAKDLQVWYRKNGKKQNDKQLFINIEKNFGDRLLKEVCIPQNMSSGACVHLAILIAKSGS